MDTTLSSGGNTNVNGTEKKNKNCHNTKDHQQQEQIEKVKAIERAKIEKLNFFFSLVNPVLGQFTNARTKNCFIS